MAEIRCQMCGKANPEELEVCQYCEARLKPLIVDPPQQEESTSSPIRPGEPPRPQNTSELEGSLPDWLQSLRNQDEEEPEEEPLSLVGETTAEAQPTSEADEDELDWLRGLADQGQSEAGTAADEEADIDWLSDLGGEETPFAGEEAAQSEIPSSELEGRLDAMLVEAGEGATESPVAFEGAETVGGEPTAMATSSEESLPDWLAEFQEEAGAAEPSAGEEVPDWLKELQPDLSVAGEQTPLSPLSEEAEAPLEEAPAGSALPGEEPLAEEAPSWLQELETPSHEEATEAGPAEVPDWLQEIAQQGEEVPPVGEGSVSPPLVQEEITEPEATAPPDTGAFDLSIEETAEGEALPDWLEELEGEAIELPEGAVPPLDFSASPEEDEELALSDLEELSLEDLPDWLTEVEGLETEGLTEEAVEEGEAIAPAELPAWLQAMRPVEAVATEMEIEEAEGEIVEYGPLAGLRGVLPAEADIAKIRKPPPYSVKLQIEERQQQRLALLQNLLITETNVASLPEPAVLPAQRLFRWLVTLVLFLAVFVPVFLGSQQVAFPSLVPPETLAVSRLVRALPEQAPVLVAFDYEPAYSGEMEAAAQPVLSDLMQKQARLILISTLPSGQAQAEQMLSMHLADFGYTTPDRYLNLGYLPGGPVGLHQFAHFPALSRPFDVSGAPVWGDPQNALHDVGRLTDFAMVMVITDDPGVARSWVEQVSPSLGETPLVMVVSSQAEPLVRPYYETTPAQVHGLVTGLEGGAAYAALIQQAGLPRVYWDGLAMGAIVAELLLLFGSLFYLGLGWWSRRRAVQG